MSEIESILVKYHHDRGDHKVRLRQQVLTPDGTLYLVRFYNAFGSCYSSLDKIDENGVVLEIMRCHQLDERKMLDSMIRRKSHETDG